MTNTEHYHGIQEAIIGTLITWPTEIDTAAALLSVHDFSTPMYQDVYEFIVKNHGADLLAIAKKFGGKYDAARIAGWGEDVVSTVFLKKQCEELLEYNRKVAIYRRIAEVKQGFDDMSSVEIIGSINSQILSMALATTSDPVPAKKLVVEANTRLESRYHNKGKLTGIPYGLDDLDKATNGLHRGDLVVIAGRPSMGKSALATNIAENVCISGKSVALFSLEMGKDQLVDRMISSIGKINFGNIRSGNFQENDFSKIMAACSVFHQFKFHVDDTPAISLSDMKAKSRKIKLESGLDVIIVDYLQLMGTKSKENRVQAIGEISRGLKQMAKELDVTVVALSQLNRSVDSRQDKRPVMSDLRDSGEIEQDADVILFPYRPAAYCEKCRDKIETDDHCCEDHQSVAEIIVEKQRNGERNLKVPLVWFGRFQRFDNILK